MVRREFAAMFLILVVGAGFAAAQAAHPGDGEWGDAPEGNLAYPTLAVIGSFPTVFANAGAGYIYHGVPTALFGTTVLAADTEGDGNAGSALFPPYDLDECYGPLDQDAGLHNPAAYTIDLGMNVIQCDPNNPMIPILGNTCGKTMPFTASIIDMWVQNFSGVPCVINVLIDWDQNGRWGGQSVCPNGDIAEEHCVVNLLVPDGYAGTMGGLGIPQIQIGPNSGYVWARFSIMNESQQPPIGWDGSGEFDIGETEDYLLRIGDEVDAEYGDAPEGALAYPNGVVGRFPTCTVSAIAGHVQHSGPSQSWFGPSVDYEFDGNIGDCSWNAYDRDECGVNDGDAGLLFPDAFTLVNGSVRACARGANRVLWNSCTLAEWGRHVDIDVTNVSPDIRYVNVLADWSEDGEWLGNTQCGLGLFAAEHLLADFPIPPGFSGPLSQLAPPDFLIGTAAEYVWVRFTISDVPLGQGWDGNANLMEGETEDYLIQVDPLPVGTDAVPQSGLIRELRSFPNPFNPRTSVRFELATAGRLELRILDVRGRVLRQLFEGIAQAGAMEVAFDGLDERGQALPSGVYFAELRIGNERRTQKLLMLK